jgi:glycosyltransferase involved in cell wall biosynthesis
MRVLMVSPHPVYSPRGTPISVFNRCLALCALGHQVDLVTYPVGQDREVPGLRYLRASVPGVQSVPVGPSFRKLILNGAVTLRSLKESMRGRGHYDVVHTHEEAGLFGPTLARMMGVPHVYDMGNDWTDVLCNYGLKAGNPITRAAGALENAVIRGSDAIIAHFPLVADRVASTSTTPVHTIFNISLEAEPDPAVATAIRRSWAPDGASVVLYSGTLEPYQGVPLLLEAMAQVARTHPEARLVIMGGRSDQVDDLQHQVGTLGLTDAVRLVGTLPSPMVPACLMAADVLVSPRERGRNTPLKIFSYLRSGRPIVATDIASHTQVLDEWSSVLVPPTAQGLALGIRSLLDEGPARHQAVEGAIALQAHYGIERYVREVAAVYAHVGGGEPDAAFVERATERIREIAASERTGPMGLPVPLDPDPLATEQKLGATVTALVGPAGRPEGGLGAIADTDNEKEAS